MKFHVHGAGAHVGFARGYALFNMSVYQTFVNESVMMMLWPMQMQGVIPGQILDEGQLDDFLGRFGMHGTTGQPQCGGDEQHLFHARHDFPLFQFFTILNPLVPQSCARVLRTACPADSECPADGSPADGRDCAHKKARSLSGRIPQKRRRFAAILWCRKEITRKVRKRMHRRANRADQTDPPCRYRPWPTPHGRGC